MLKLSIVWKHLQMDYLSFLTRCHASFGRPTPLHISLENPFYIHCPSAPNPLRLAAWGWGCCQWWTSNTRSGSGHPLCSYSPTFHSLLQDSRNTNVCGRSEHHCSPTESRARRSRCAVIQRPGRLRFSSFWLVRLWGRWGRDEHLRLAAILQLYSLFSVNWVHAHLLSAAWCKANSSQLPLNSEFRLNLIMGSLGLQTGPCPRLWWLFKSHIHSLTPEVTRIM